SAQTLRRIASGHIVVGKEKAHASLGKLRPQRRGKGGIFLRLDIEPVAEGIFFLSGQGLPNPLPPGRLIIRPGAAVAAEADGKDGFRNSSETPAAFLAEGAGFDCDAVGIEKVRAQLGHVAGRERLPGAVVVAVDGGYNADDSGP